MVTLIMLWALINGAPVPLKAYLVENPTEINAAHRAVKVCEADVQMIRSYGEIAWCVPQIAL